MLQSNYSPLDCGGNLIKEEPGNSKEREQQKQDSDTERGYGCQRNILPRPLVTMKLATAMPQEQELL